MGSAASTPTTPSAEVSTIFVYPIKSCRGISVSQAPLASYGFRWDRQWMIVNPQGRAYTQRIESKLALIEVELPHEAFLEDWEPTQDSYMVVKAPGMQPLKICLSKQQSEVADRISLWEWTGSAWDEGAEASQWFSDYIGKPGRLVRFNTAAITSSCCGWRQMAGEACCNHCDLCSEKKLASQTRPVDPDYAKGQQETLFTDGYQFLLVSQESLDALNEVLKEPIPINRFRPNILVKGCNPYSEDLWTQIKISRFSFFGVKLCWRCKMPSIDQETATLGAEPKEILAKTRSGKLIRPNDIKNKNRVYFGQNLVWNKKELSAKGSGKIIKVGDPVYVLQQVSSSAEASA